MFYQTLSPDTSEAAEREVFASLHAMGKSERARLAHRHNENVWGLMQDALWRARSGWSKRQLMIEWARIHYGEDVAALVTRSQQEPDSNKGLGTWSRDFMGMYEERQESPEARILEPAVRELEDVDVQLYVGGSMASAWWGHSRAARDMDIIAPGLPEEHARYLQRTLSRDFFCAETFLGGNRVWNFVHRASAWKIDLFAPPRQAYEENIIARRDSAVLFEGGSEIWVEPAEDNVLSRLRWMQASGRRELPWLDAVGVLKVNAPYMDLDYLKRWADELDVDKLLEKALDEAGLNQKS